MCKTQGIIKKKSQELSTLQKMKLDKVKVPKLFCLLNKNNFSKHIDSR